MFTSEFGNAIEDITLRDTVMLEKFFFRSDRRKAPAPQSDKTQELSAMARIPEAEIERLKEAVPVARLVEASGVELKKGGKDLLGRCPFHEDATASLVVT